MLAAITLAAILASQTPQTKAAKAAKVAKPVSTEVNLFIAGNVAPSAKIHLFVNSKNVRQVPIRIYKLPLEDLRHQYDPRRTKPTPGGRPIRNFSLDVAGKKKTLPAPQDTYYQRQSNILNLPPGYYLIEAPGYKGQAWATMNVTNLSIIVKRGEKHALTWVTDYKSGRAVSGATIITYREGKQSKTGQTDREGISTLDIPPGQDVVVVKTGRDAAAVSVVGTTREGQVVSHMQFDRPVYRPGQTGMFKAILRRIHGLGYSPISNDSVTMELFDSQSTLLDRQELKTTPMGTVAGSFKLPKEGSLGYYSVHLRKGDESLAYEDFQVSEYRKPEFKATSEFSQKRYLSGEPIKLKLSTEYYFGAKVPNARVQVMVRRSPMSWGGGGFEYSDGNLYAGDTYAANQVVLNDFRTTAADGTLQIEIPTTSEATDFQYSFDFTITDGANRQIKNAASIPVYAASIRTSAEPTVGYVPLGRLLPLEIRLADLDGRPVSGQVTVELRHSVWDEKQKRNIEQTLESTTVQVPASGKVKASIPAKERGYLSIVATAKDSGGRVTRSRSGIYVADPFSEPDEQKKPPNVNVRLEKKDYVLGDTAQGFVESNRPGHPILLTMESSDLISYKILSKPGSFSFKLDAPSSPNMTFAVSQWVEGGHYSGGTMVRVVDPTRRLQVSVKPDKTEVAPGDHTKYTVETRDSNGRPISAEVGLQVIDEAIYAVQPDQTANLIDTFWGYREPGVQTVDSAPQEMSGGAYQMQKNANKDAPMRTQFVDTAYWNPFVQTGSDGEATVEFDMPGNLTAWHTTARAVTESTQVGQAEAMTRSSRPITLRLATPRQMVVGDKLDLIGTITNRTTNPQSVRVQVKVGDETQNYQVSAPATGDAKVHIPLDAKALGNLPVRGEVFDASGTRLDGLEVGVPVNPNGVPFREVTAGRTKGGKIPYTVPADGIFGSQSAKVRFYPGAKAMLPVIERNLLDSSRYTPIVAAEQVEVAAGQNIPWMDDRIREPIAMLGRTHQSTGWGWWDEGSPDPVITARVLRGLAATKNYPEWEALRGSARSAAEYQYGHVQFAEYRALLVEALALDGSDKAKPWTAEVDESKTPISPTAQLALANALALTGNTARAKERVTALTALVSRGTTSFLPVGNGVGWTGSELEANARLLDLLLRLDSDNPIIDGLADWVIAHASSYMGPGDSIAALRAIHRYSDARPSADRVGTLHVKANGVEVPVTRQPDGEWAEADIPADAVGKAIEVDGVDQPLRYVLEAKAYHKAENEVSNGIRTMIRWEVMNQAGSWEELNRAIKPNEPIRVSAIAWGDSVTDAVRVVIPIPAGFEYVDQDRLTYARQEVRDGAVIYYTVLANSLPATFRFYLRAESDGTISVPAAMVEAIRRAEVHGNSNALSVTVKGE
ncbi:MAG: hypothetical protein JST51_13155 [Armatimonadetes bacterium]|nr:hypothetical protein [Armatimonadota bacterium]